MGALIDDVVREHLREMMMLTDVGYERNSIKRDSSLHQLLLVGLIPWNGTLKPALLEPVGSPLPFETVMNHTMA